MFTDICTLLIIFTFNAVDTNKPKPTGPVKPKEDSVKPPPTPRDTLGAALDRLRPKKPSSQFAGKSQNELIEEFNRRRNQGLDAPENPDFRPNGEPVLLRDRNRDQPLPSTTQPSSKYKSRDIPKTL